MRGQTQALTDSTARAGVGPAEHVFGYGIEVLKFLFELIEQVQART